MYSPSKLPSLTLGLLTRSAKPKARDWAIALLLFLATAVVVIWQNSRLGVLWDLSYVLDNSYRIALGDIPYRDFPLVHPPLTFLIQAAIIKFSGRVFWHTAAYCAIAGGLGTVLSWRILANLLRGLQCARWLASLLSVPLIVLGIYCVFPHPFYDPDCTLAILVSVLLLLKSEQSSSWPTAFCAGISVVIPVFVKQNAGLAFLGSAGLALLVLIAIEIIRHRTPRRYLLIIAGVVASLGIALLAIHFTAGLGNYWRWTMRFAAARRTPALSEMIGIYRQKSLLLWLAILAAGVVLWRLRAKKSSALAIGSGLLLAAPFVWPAIYLLRESDPSERAERLIGVWPVVLIAALVVSVINLKQRKGIPAVLPLILIATINGAFMSQQLWGSTYAIWPLLMILLACTIAALAGDRLDPGLVPQTIGRTNPPAKQVNGSGFFVPAVVLAALSLTIAGWAYVRSHERLDYANLSDGALTRSSLPPLKGLSVQGDWLPDFEELVRYSESKIPHEDALLIVPGEDLFYYTAGRRPRFPVLQFDHTVNPYSPEEILRICREHGVRWLIVKQDLQDEDEQLEADRDRLVEVLENEYEQVDSLKNYDIYRRIEPAKKEEEDLDSEPER